MAKITKKANTFTLFIIMSAIMLLAALIAFLFIMQTNSLSIERAVNAVDEKPSFGTYVVSAYEVAAECFLKRIALNDGELAFSSKPSNSLAAAGDFMESVIDKVFQNFTIFTGRNIQKEKLVPELVLKDSSVMLKVDQKFDISVDSRKHTIKQFYTTIPNKLGRMIKIRNKALEEKNLELNPFYEEELLANAYKAQDKTIIELTGTKDKKDMKYVFVK